MPDKPFEDERQRLDKWLFFSRLVKSRALAQELIEAGFVRVNGQTVTQPSRSLKIGDRLDVALERRDVVLVVKAPGDRRGSPGEARLLFDDLTPQQAPLSAFERAQRKLRPDG